MSSPLPTTPVPTSFEQAEKVIPTVIDDINQRIADVRKKAAVRKSIVLDSEFLKRAKSQAKRIFDRKSQIMAAGDQDSKSLETPPLLPRRPESDDRGREEVHVSFQSPLAEQIGTYQDLIANNIDAILRDCMLRAQAQVKEELAKWINIIQQEAELDA